MSYLLEPRTRLPRVVKTQQKLRVSSYVLNIMFWFTYDVRDCKLTRSYKSECLWR